MLLKILKILRKFKRFNIDKTFEEVDVGSINREKKCRISRTLAKDMKSHKLLPRSKHHKEK